MYKVHRNEFGACFSIKFLIGREDTSESRSWIVRKKSSLRVNHYCYVAGVFHKFARSPSMSAASFQEAFSVELSERVGAFRCNGAQPVGNDRKQIRLQWPRATKQSPRPPVLRESEEVAHNETKRGITSLATVQRRRPGSASRSCLITACVSRGKTNCNAHPSSLLHHPLSLSPPCCLLCHPAISPRSFLLLFLSRRFPLIFPFTEREREAAETNRAFVTRPRKRRSTKDEIDLTRAILPRNSRFRLILDQRK